jgi:hypothetical protein
VLAVVFAVLFVVGCGDSGPSGRDAKVIEQFEDLGLSREEAESEVRQANREGTKQARKEGAQIRREVREEELQAPKARPKEKNQPPGKQSPAEAGATTANTRKRMKSPYLLAVSVPISRSQRNSISRLAPTRSKSRKHMPTATTVCSKRRPLRVVMPGSKKGRPADDPHGFHSILCVRVAPRHCPARCSGDRR